VFPSCLGCPPGFRFFFSLEFFFRLGSMAGGRLLFFEVFLMDLDSNIYCLRDETDKISPEFRVFCIFSRLK
jgi:hypothetical protein